jgi:WD40 repeat protein
MDNKEKAYHRILAEYFMAQPCFLDEKDFDQPNTHKCIEQPFQQMMAEMWKEASTTLCDLLFFDAKIKIGLLGELQSELVNLLKSGTEKQIDFISNNKNEIKCYLNFLNVSFTELNSSKKFRYNVFQQALNYSADDPVSISANQIVGHISDWVFYNELTKPKYISSEPLLKKSIRIDLSGDISIDATPDLELIACAANNEIRIYKQDSSVAFKKIKTAFTITDIRFTHNNNELLLVDAADKNLYYYDYSSECVVDTVHVHELNEYFAVSQDFEIVAFGHDANFRAFDIKSSKQLFEAHPVQYTGYGRIPICHVLAFSPDNKHIVKGTREKGVLSYALNDPETFKSYSGWAFALSESGSLLITGGGYLDRSPPHVYLYNYEKGSLLQTLKGHKTWIRAVDIHPESNRAITCDTDGMIFIWDIANGKLEKNFKGTFGPTWMKISKDGRTFITHASDNIRIWNTNGKIPDTSFFDGPTPQVLSEISSSGSHIVAQLNSTKRIERYRCRDRKHSEDTLAVYDLKNKRNTILQNSTARESYSAFCMSTLLSPDKQLIAELNYDSWKTEQLTGTGSIRIWNTAEGTQVYKKKLSYSLEAIFSPNSRILAAKSRVIFALDKSAENALPNWFNCDAKEITKISLLDAYDGTIIYESYVQDENDKMKGLHFTSDGRLLLHGIENGFSTIDISSGIEIIHHTNNPERFSYLKLSPCNRLILNYKGGSKGILMDLALQKQLCEIDLLEASDGYFTITFSQDGKHIVVFVNQKRLTVISVKTGKPVFEIKLKSTAIEFLLTPDSQSIIIKDYNEIIIYNVATGSEKNKFNISKDFIGRDNFKNPTVLCGVSLNSKYISIATSSYGRYGFDNPLNKIWTREVDSQKSLLVYDITTSDNTGNLLLDRSFNYIHQSNNTLVFTQDDNLKVFQLSDMYSDVSGEDAHAPLCTAARIWIQDSQNMYWEEDVTMQCLHCGERFPVPSAVLNVIESMNRTYSIGLDDSPVLKLPDEAWDEQKLIFDCPKCGGKLKSNPFVVDNKDLYSDCR